MTDAFAPGSGLSHSRSISGRWVAVFVAMVGMVTALWLGWLARPKPIPRAGATTLTAAPAAPVWMHLIANREPPSDIVDRVVVPSDHGPVTYLNHDASAGQYDREADFSVAVPVADAVAFYQREFALHGWRVTAVAPARNSGGGTQVVATRDGSDAYVWVAAATVIPHGSDSLVALDLQQQPPSSG